MVKKKRILAFVLSLALIVVTFTACGGGGSEEADSSGGETITLRLASDAPKEHIATQLNEEACALIEERTEGRVKVTYHGAGQLGGYDTVYNELMTGSIDLAQITVPDAMDPRLGVPYAACMAMNYEDAAVMLGPDSFLFEQFSALNAENGVTFLGFLLEGFIGIGTVDEPTDMFVPGADKGIKLRVAAVDVQRIVADEMGFDPVTVAYGEVPTAIQTGVVDGWLGGTPNLNYSWVGEVINNFYMNYIQMEATAYVMSDASLEKLSEEDAAIVKEVFAEQSAKSFELAEENDANYMQKMQDDYGVEVITLTDEQLQEQAEFVRENVWPLYAELFSQEWMDAIAEEVDAL